MITQEDLKKLFSYDYETGLFTRIVNAGSAGSIGDIAGGISLSGYRSLCINYKRYYVHRLVWLYVYGKNPENQIDHINRIRSDNRISNLRDVTSQENARNRTPSINMFGVLGLSWCKRSNKFYASITINRKTKYLGYYSCMFDAVCARKSAENKYNFNGV